MIISSRRNTLMLVPSVIDVGSINTITNDMKNQKEAHKDMKDGADDKGQINALGCGKCTQRVPNFKYKSID